MKIRKGKQLNKEKLSVLWNLATVIGKILRLRRVEKASDIMRLKTLSKTRRPKMTEKLNCDRKPDMT